MSLFYGNRKNCNVEGQQQLSFWWCVDVLVLFFIHWIVPLPLERTFCGAVVPTELHTNTAVLLYVGCGQSSSRCMGPVYGPMYVLSHKAVFKSCASSAFHASLCTLYQCNHRRVRASTGQASAW